MNRLHLSLASLLMLLLAGCVSYGTYYGQPRAVYQDGDYYVAGDSQYGDYYYGAPEVEYRYVDSWSSYGFWRMDRYRCDFYGDCWRYRGYRHWDPFASHWSYWPGPSLGLSIVVAPSWYYGHWGWHDHRHDDRRHDDRRQHDRRDRPRREHTHPYDAAPSRPIAPRTTEPRTTEPGATMPPRRPLPSRYDGEYRRVPRDTEAGRLPRLRESQPSYPPTRPAPRPLTPETGYGRPRQPERATLPVQPRTRIDAEAPRQWQRPSPPASEPRHSPPPSPPMSRPEPSSERTERTERTERSPRSRDGIEP